MAKGYSKDSMQETQLEMKETTDFANSHVFGVNELGIVSIRQDDSGIYGHAIEKVGVLWYLYMALASVSDRLSPGC